MGHTRTQGDCDAVRADRGGGGGEQGGQKASGEAGECAAPQSAGVEGDDEEQDCSIQGGMARDHLRRRCSSAISNRAYTLSRQLLLFARSERRRTEHVTAQNCQHSRHTYTTHEHNMETHPTAHGGGSELRPHADTCPLHERKVLCHPQLPSNLSNFICFR